MSERQATVWGPGHETSTPVGSLCARTDCPQPLIVEGVLGIALPVAVGDERGSATGEITVHMHRECFLTSFFGPAEAPLNLRAAGEKLLAALE